ncbi:MAG: calcium-binding protein, partial [Planctomycetaceae bacterium]
MIETLEDRTLLSFTVPIQNFAGQGYSFVGPPDTIGDVGISHYVQAINGTSGAKIEIYNKSDGTVAVPQFYLDTLAAGATGGTAYNGFGDPVVVYDQNADRWLLLEFEPPGAGNRLHIFISDTGVPTGNGADWTHYRFAAPSFPDYPKIGVWHDAYFIGTNDGGNSVYALPRQQMLTGNGGDITANVIRRASTDLPNWLTNQIMPADLDGSTPPPAGAPGIFLRQVDDELTTPATANANNDFLEIWEFAPDFNTPTNSTYAKVADIPIADFDRLIGANLGPGSPDIEQPGTSVQLDSLPHFIMWRLQYRNFGTYETLVANFTVDTGEDATPDLDGGTAAEQAGVRWFELRKTGGGSWALHQEGDIAPDTTHRWMGSAGMNGDGSIAVGYSASSTTVSPSIRYSGRRAGDAAGTMQAESVLMAGTGAVLNSGGRWGDYSSLSIDPVDDATFWFTTEYADGSNNWATRIGEFAFDDSDVNIYATMSSDNILVRRNGINIEVFFDSQLVKSLAIATLNSLEIHGLNGDDTLTVDHSGGMITASLTYKGDSGNDRIIVSGDYDYTLTDTLLVNPGAASVTLENVEQALLTGGASDNSLDASGFSGNATLWGLDGNDTLYGGASDDVLDGGLGTDQVRQSINADQVLADSQLTGMGTDVLLSIEEAQLTGGSNPNTLDASAFSGTVTLAGLDGNDTLHGAAGDDLLDGGLGTDQIRQTIDADQLLTNSQLTGMGTDTLLSIEQAQLTGGIDNNTLDASAFSAGPVTLWGLDGDDTLYGSSSADVINGDAGTDQIRQTIDANQVLVDTLVTGDGNDTLSSIEQAQLTGGSSGNSIDASGFTGPVTLTGLDGDDLLWGGTANDSLEGGNGNDTLWGQAGDDSLDGGSDTDLVRQTVDAHQTLINTLLTGEGSDLLANIETGWLIGGNSDNAIDATGFNLGPVTLAGAAGNDTLTGSDQDDSIDGGTGTDLVLQTVDANQTLTDTSLTGRGTDSLSSIELASLTGGNSANRIDAAAFTGTVTLVAAGGDDTLVGAAGNDSLDAGPGNDLLEQTADADQVLTNSSVTGDGNDTLAGFERAILTGGASDNTLDPRNFTL